MLDPQTYILLHKYQQVDRMKQIEENRLRQIIERSSIHLPSLSQLSRFISSWRTERRQTRKETRLVEGKIVMP
jgi:hypothetical protein